MTMRPQERLLLELLNAGLRSDSIRGDIDLVVERVARKLAQDLTSPPLSHQSPDHAEKSERRREGARKAAATVRARRQAQKVEKAVAESMDRIAAHVVHAEAELAQAAADPPGTLRARDLVATARSQGLEFDLFIHAHRIRAPWHAADWPADIRKQLGDWLTSRTSATGTTPRAKKGPRR